MINISLKLLWLQLNITHTRTDPESFGGGDLVENLTTKGCWQAS